MSENPTTTPATDPAANGGATGGDPSTTPPAPSDKAPKWEGDFDPDKAARLVANLRDELAAVKGRLKTREDAEKSDLQKAQERAEKLAADLKAERQKDAAKSHKLPASLAKHLTGETAEEIAASAKALADELGLAQTEAEPLPGRPKPRLRPGHAAPGDTSGAFDPAAVIKAARGY
ncbi:hypothetical protein [Micromonospora sp. NPDC023956]|uniref:hypothetical protein n=1 Tax=Micromonospora sp. NPDC023956 TaxID=3155722 RepID=UPI0033DDCAE9